MPLHNHKTTIDDLFTVEAMTKPLNVHRISRKERNPEAVYQMIHDELLLDGNSRQNMATFCSTWLEREVHELMHECIDKNMIDKDEYPQTANIESRCVSMLSNLWNAKEVTDPAAKDHSPAIGCSTTGSSEAAMLGGMALKWNWKARQKAAGKPYDKPNLVCGPVQVCWHKFARYWEIELRELPMHKGSYMSSPEDVLAHCDENTIGVVQTLGTTFTGHYEPIEEVHAALDKLQQDTGLDIPMHIDAASGGFVAPFMHPEIKWDFRLSRVKSINSSGHKFGLSPLGCGWVIWASEKDLPEDLIFRVNYLGGQMPTFALNFSRPGGEVIAQYYNLLRLGFEGYMKVQGASYDAARFFTEGLKKFGLFEFINDSSKGLPLVCWKFKDNAKAPFSLYQLSDELRQRGWLIPTYTLPPDCEDIVVQRIVVRHGTTVDMLHLLLKDFKEVIDELMESPPCGPDKERKSFNHS
ncbi:glutamate decarboxylase [Halodesulfovibrio marinisediminis]|uniref:Glutamate decarboxylase n=1 Tax=Halodesulfovibrio marinisediminis DSM 17456 TaxID=1121457 RepID=A0A1N6IB26_9BACT|nr:glutamate decarboxylase [Halodesulfovibrio marinisediminis]SIO29227.1 glutamate decarboxylase [Halodesulfovibrio marinisediminis DSM 17456]